MIGVRGDMAAIGGGRGVEAEGGDRDRGAGGGRGLGPGPGQGTEGQGAGEGQGVTVEGATPGAEARIPSRAEIRDLSRGAEAEQRDLRSAHSADQDWLTSHDLLHQPFCSQFHCNFYSPTPDVVYQYFPSKNNVFRKKLKLVFAAAETSSAVLICCADA